jgi:FG-GAP repeat
VVKVRRVTVVLILVLAVGVWSAVSGVARGSTAGQAQPPGSLQADFNNDGADDLAVGVPFEDVGGIGDAGAVNVLYGTTGGLTGSGSQVFTQDSPGVGGGAEIGDWFGFALAGGDFNNDGFADLAVGVPGEGVGSAAGAGAVNVLYGSAGGLTGGGGQLFTQVAGAIEAFDNFGWALTTGDFNNDGAADLAAGAPFEDVGSIGDAGAVSVIYGSADGLPTSGGQLFTQVGSAPETDDHFGQALAGGDFDNDGAADLAVGAPFEAVGSSRPGAGAVSVIYGSAAGLTTTGGQLFTQVAGAVEAFDLFGDALAAGDYDNDGAADLAAGAVFEDVGSIVNAGAVSVIYGSAAGLTGAGGQLFTQDSPGVGGNAEVDDLFGFALAAGDPGPSTASATPSASGSRTQRTAPSR